MNIQAVVQYVYYPSKWSLVFELFTEDVVKSNSFVLFHHFDVKLEFTHDERSSEVMVVLATFTIKLKPYF